LTTEGLGIGVFYPPQYGALIQHSGNLFYRSIEMGYVLKKQRKFQMEVGFAIGVVNFYKTNSEVTVMTSTGPYVDNTILRSINKFKNHYFNFSYIFDYNIDNKLSLHFYSGFFLLRHYENGVALEVDQFTFPMLSNSIGFSYKIN
jgi:hypothetical protein